MAGFDAGTCGHEPLTLPLPLQAYSCLIFAQVQFEQFSFVFFSTMLGEDPEKI